jgi:cellulose synthase/poly-beta-1,6-N-acetylglucosamine synthase-like glycosyltransferase
VYAPPKYRPVTARQRLTVVAVPARDEAERIGACLSALCDQRGLDGSPLPAGSVKVVVVANNCRDGTADAARAVGGPVEVLEANLPRASANAGGARRAAMEAAASLAQTPQALICTTDADSRPRADWIAQLWQGLDGGAEAVAGAVDFDPSEASPLRFSDIRRQESLYSALQAEIIARVDPEAHNPWPNHIWAWGANLAVTADAYRRVGGLPPRPLAEDRAFVEELRRFDVPVRHCLDARVWTSVRREGRAAGGLASLVADHAGADCAPCDAALEPVRTIWRRTAWRRRLRQAYFDRATPTRLASSLRLPLYLVHEALEQPTFGAAWNRVRQTSPRLAGRRLNPLELRREISRAERLLRRIAPADPAGRARAASAGLWSAPAPHP